MADIIRLQPHDPLPEGRYVAVLRRFDEDDARRVVTEIILHGTSGAETARPTGADGRAMAFDDAISQAVQVADSERIPAVHAIDRTAGAREQEVLRHSGDHSVNMDGLSDSDMEEGERGPDMRDMVHDSRGVSSGPGEG